MRNPPPSRSVGDARVRLNDNGADYTIEHWSVTKTVKVNSDVSGSYGADFRALAFSQMGWMAFGSLLVASDE